MLKNLIRKIVEDVSEFEEENRMLLVENDLLIKENKELKDTNSKLALDLKRFQTKNNISSGEIVQMYEILKSHNIETSSIKEMYSEMITKKFSKK